MVDAGAGGRRDAPRVVVYEASAFDALRELSAALSRRGVDVVHLHPRYAGRGGRVKGAVDSLTAPTVLLDEPLESPTPESAALRRSLLERPTADVHALEPYVAALAGTAEWRANPDLRHCADGLDPAQIRDKVAVDAIAREAGVPVPDSGDHGWDGTFPAVVKARHGAGGDGVRVVHDRGGLEQARAALDPRDEGLLVQRFYPGTGLASGGVAHAGEVLTAVAYEREARHDDPLGPSQRVRITDRPDVLEATTRLMGALGYTGIFCLNFVPGTDGGPLLIDVNLRAFGSWAALECAGVPIVDSYVALLHGRPEARRPPSPTGDWLPVLQVGNPGGRSTRDHVAAMSRLAWERRGVFGTGWAVDTQTRLARELARRHD